MRDAGWWNVIDKNAALLATAIHNYPARSHSKGCARGGGVGRRNLRRGPKGAPVMVAPEGNLPPLKPAGILVEVPGPAVKRHPY